MISTSKRLEGIGEYYFSKKLREIEELNKSGKDVINLGIGSPDLPPHPDVIKVLKEESSKPNSHAYQSYKGSPVLRDAFCQWYRQWYNVKLDPATEILPLMGSKEGIMHICMTYLDKEDEVLVPNPGYPTYASAVKLSGGKIREYLLRDLDSPENLEALINKSDGRIKLMFVNFPHMPTGELPDKSLFERLVSFAGKNNILIIHDNPYSFILNDEPMSLLSIPGAMEHVIELNSLSKSHNMAGWRVGVMIAAKERIEEVLRFRSNMDSGMFLPLQLAAARALQAEKDWYDGVNTVYTARRQKVYTLLERLGCSFIKKQSGLFIWAHVPTGVPDGFSFSGRILNGAGVFITPGGIFGSAGHEYIRVSLCSPVERIEQAIKRIDKNL